MFAKQRHNDTPKHYTIQEKPKGKRKMKKVIITALVDEKRLIDVYSNFLNERVSFGDALSSELNVMEENGISILDWKTVDKN